MVCPLCSETNTGGKSFMHAKGRSSLYFPGFLFLFSFFFFLFSCFTHTQTCFNNQKHHFFCFPQFFNQNQCLLPSPSTSPLLRLPTANLRWSSSNKRETS